jgi:hypothetical protein
MKKINQFRLLKERRFAPFFMTQFLGAGNDNIFKFALTVLSTYSAAEWGGLMRSNLPSAKFFLHCSTAI